MQGREVEIEAADGGTFQGYLSLPEGGTGPGLVVLQEIFGVNAHIREVCDSFAEEGYVTLAPDLFWRVEPGLQLGYGEEDREKAFAVLGRFDEDRSAEDIAQTVAHLRAHEACEGGVGAMGFCLGGKLAYLAPSARRRKFTPIPAPSTASIAARGLHTAGRRRSWRIRAPSRCCTAPLGRATI